MLGDHSGVVPPDPIPNSEVKRASANGSVHSHARVGHRQAPFAVNNAQPIWLGVVRLQGTRLSLIGVEPMLVPRVGHPRRLSS